MAAMKIQFDPNQSFQLEAIAAVTDLFDGQPQGAPEYSIVDRGGHDSLFGGQERSELGVGNRLLLDMETLRANLHKVQDRNDLAVEDAAAPVQGWELFDTAANSARLCPHFSVEMETGTGKTYVYLRTIFELAHKYGLQKFVIVVPSVAIREGVLKNIEITADHFRTLYNNLPFEHFVYDAKRVNRLRQFATANTLQILVINIDAFRRNFTGTEAEQKSNVIYKESDKLSGRQPIEFVQAARPIVIIDEPQSVDSTDKAQEALKALNPLCTLRYSATHRNVYNLVYRLDPVAAFERKLVKQIVVASASGSGSANDAFVRVEQIDYKKGLQAKLRIHVQQADGPKEKLVTVKYGDDLHIKSNERAGYADGFVVNEINAEPGSEYIRFNNGRTLRLGQESGGMRQDLWRAQIKYTLKRHLDNELRVRERGIKVLSLFFIDRVANYRDYADGKPKPGKFALEFESVLSELALEPQYAALEWLKQPLASLHNGYFSQDKGGVLKDTRGDTQADDDTYNLIMKEKERLLSLDEPLRFIFSHSALREGWDNPNVFQICTLNETRSVMKKRQEIGRGLRLPVDQSGRRVFDDSINKLYVMANESYEDFARSLQTEYEEECGVTFGKLPPSAIARLTRVVDGEEQAIGKEAAAAIQAALVAQNMLDEKGFIREAFNPRRLDFRLELPPGHEDLAAQVVDLLSSYQLERHIARAQDTQTNHLKKAVALSPEFAALWERIKPKTTYRVEFDTAALVYNAVLAIKRMERIEPPKINIQTAGLRITHSGIDARLTHAAKETAGGYDTRPVPDLLAYLQNETELTRSTLVRILKESGRLGEFFNDPQRFMDTVARYLKYELHRMLVDGIKYERLDGPGAEWEMLLFENSELVSYLNALPVKKSVYEYIVYDSEVERQFAARLDEREDIRLFVKLPNWFTIDTPVGKYNPDWAILKHDGQALYLVRETKGTRNILELRSSEADKIRCGQRHFEALGVSFAVVVSGAEV